MFKQVASALAEAMLASSPSLDATMNACSRVLGNSPPWLRILLKDLINRFASRWQSGIHAEIVAYIMESPLFAHARVGGKRLYIRQYPLIPPQMAAATFSDVCRPNLPNPAELARWLGINLSDLQALIESLQFRDGPAFRKMYHYHYRWVEKASGGKRLLEIPKSRLVAIQRRILRGILEYIPPHDAAHGFRRGHSCLTHAEHHAGQRLVVRIDLEDFFPSVGAARVRAVFRSLGYPEAVARCLTVLCTHRVPGSVAKDLTLPGHNPEQSAWQWQGIRRLRSPHLPQGAPTSPALANLCAFRLDQRLAGLADRFGAGYSRYADDLTFSGGESFRRDVQRFLPFVGAITAEEGFAVNFRKTRIMPSAQRQCVTGLTVNQKPNVDRRYLEKIKAILHNCRRHGPRSQTALPLAQFRHQLAGHVAHIAAIHPQRGAKLKAIFQSIEWD